ncbi:MAG: hypothetical protein EBX46_05155 [Burkholderiaceae bacterium]|nr:hypothetical protein [Burkholderiaceae bacterium]
MLSQRIIGSLRSTLDASILSRLATISSSELALVQSRPKDTHGSQILSAAMTLYDAEHPQTKQIFIVGIGDSFMRSP